LALTPGPLYLGYPVIWELAGAPARPAPWSQNPWESLGGAPDSSTSPDRCLGTRTRIDKVGTRECQP